QLRVVPNAPALRGGRPVVVEDELALAVGLHVERTAADQPVAFPQRQMLWQPSGVGSDGPGLLEDREPVPLEEGRPVADQRIPGVARDVAEGGCDPERRHRYAVSDRATSA